MSDNKELNVICLYLVNGQVVIGNLVDSESSIELEYPYNLRINHEQKLEYIPYLSEFTDDDVFAFNSNVVINAFSPHDKYKTKYLEIYNQSNKQLLS